VAFAVPLPRSIRYSTACLRTLPRQSVVFVPDDGASRIAELCHASDRDAPAINALASPFYLSPVRPLTREPSEGWIRRDLAFFPESRVPSTAVEAGESDWTIDLHDSIFDSQLDATQFHDRGKVGRAGTRIVSACGFIVLVSSHARPTLGFCRLLR
jgi:hypothetical protein